MSILSNNLLALEQQNPLLFQTLNTYQENQRFHVHIDQNDPVTLNLIDAADFVPLYSGSPQSEVAEQVERLGTLSEYPYLYFFGMGNGVLAYLLLNNPARKRILVFEPEAEILWIVFHFIDFSDMIRSAKLVLISRESLSFSAVIGFFGETDVKRHARVYDLLPASPFYERYSETLQELNQLFIHAIHHVITAVGNDVKDTLIGIEHHFRHIDFMLQTPKLYELFKKAKNTEVAVLVSTGPSLNKQLALLKEAAPYVTIVAVDASFPVLTRHGIRPDIVVSMERVVLSSEFFKKTPPEAFDGVVFALSSLQHPEVIKSIKGGTVQMSMRPFGFMQLFGLDEWGYLGIGMSAANMAYELIYHSRFRHCVLIGQDLAYADSGLSHAEGHVFGTDEVKSKTTDLEVVRYGGEGTIRTSAIWNGFRMFFETDIRETSARMTTINATEGGARIHGAVEMPFREVCETLVKRDRVKMPIILEKTKKSDLKTAQRKADTQKRWVVKALHELKDEAEQLYVATTTIGEISAQKRQELFEAIERYFLKTQNGDYRLLLFESTQAMVFHLEMKIAEVKVRSVSGPGEEEQKIIDVLKLYQEWLYSFAGCIHAMLIAIERKGSHYDE